MAYAVVHLGTSNHDAMNFVLLVIMEATVRANANARMAPHATLSPVNAAALRDMLDRCAIRNVIMEGLGHCARRSACATGSARWDATTFLENASVLPGSKVSPVRASAPAAIGAPPVRICVTVRTTLPVILKLASASAREVGWARTATKHAQLDYLARIAPRCVLTA